MSDRPVIAMPELEKELGRIADELDRGVANVDRLYARRLALWRKAKAAGLPSVTLARASRVQSVTVRSILHRDELDR